jgi:hypothetical protein
MVSLRARPELACLHFDEVADVHVFGEPRSWTDPCVRANAAALPDSRLFQQTERLDASVAPDGDIPEYAVCADLDAVAERHLTFEDAVHIDPHVASHCQCAAHVEPIGVGERDASVHERLGLPPLVEPFDVRELCAAVDPERF